MAGKDDTLFTRGLSRLGAGFAAAQRPGRNRLCARVNMVLKWLCFDLKNLADKLCSWAKMNVGRREQLESKNDDTGHCQQHRDRQAADDCDPRAPALPASALARRPVKRHLLCMTPACYLRCANSSGRRVVILGAKRA